MEIAKSIRVVSISGVKSKSQMFWLFFSHGIQHDIFVSSVLSVTFDLAIII